MSKERRNVSESLPEIKDEAELSRLMADLDEGGRDLVRLKFYEEKTNEEIAELLGIGPDEVLQQLRIILQRLEGAEPADEVDEAFDAEEKTELEQFKDKVSGPVPEKITGAILNEVTGELKDLGINPATVIDLSNRGIETIAGLTSMTTEEFIELGLHHKSVRSIARTLVDSGIFFADGKEATEALLEGRISGGRGLWKYQGRKR